MAAEWEKRIMRDGKEMKEIHQEFLTGERALFQGKDLKIYDTIFDDGESPLKRAEILNYTEACSNGNIRCGMRKISRQRTVPGLRWHARVCGIRTGSK